MKRVVGYAVGGVVSLALVAASAVAFHPWVAARQTGPAASGSLLDQSLGGRVRIERDPFGVPHIDAEHLNDAFFALGLVHAQDRLWQMEILRRTATGRLSEYFGAETLEEDRFARTLGLGHAARVEAARLSSASAERVEAYAAGVNRWLREIEEGRAEPPFEMRWLGVEPEPWTPADTIAIVRYRAWQMSRSIGSSLLLDRLVRELGGLGSRDFFPRAPGANESAARLVPLFQLGRVADRWASRGGLLGRVGSHGFVVGAHRSASGEPLLANDPHVEFKTPAVFYFAHVKTPAWEVAGGTWPGVPVFWMGTNLSIAWGQVALHLSVSDLYEETLNPRDPRRYDHYGRWRDLDRRKERIEVRGATAETLEVMSTRHGPLLAGIVRDDGDSARLALRWTGQSEESALEPLLRVQRAGDWDQFRAALADHVAPAATWLYADVSGNIGTQVAGHLPRRSIETGMLPVPGSTGIYDWTGVVGFEALPSRFGTDEPWLLAATRPPDRLFDSTVMWLWSRDSASERVPERLERGKVDLEDVIALQRERVASFSRAQVRSLVSIDPGDSREGARAARELLEWDGSTAIDSRGAAFYHLFRYFLTRRLLAERLDESQLEAVLSAAEPAPGLLLARFLERVPAEEAARHVKGALLETSSWLGVNVSSNRRKWTWGQLQHLILRHDFEQLGGWRERWVARALRVGPRPIPGSSDSLWATHSGPQPPFEARVGPVARFAIDLGEPRQPMVGLAGGQSGHRGSAWYEDALEDWLAGRARPLWMHAGDVSYHSRGVWELRPRTDRRSVAGSPRG